MWVVLPILVSIAQHNAREDRVVVEFGRCRAVHVRSDPTHSFKLDEHPRRHVATRADANRVRDAVCELARLGLVGLESQDAR